MLVADEVDEGEQLAELAFLQVQDGLRCVVVEKGKVRQQLLAHRTEGVKIPGENQQIAVVVFFPGDEVHLAGREEMDAVGMDGERPEVDVVPPGAVVKNAYFVVGVAVGLVCFVWVLAVDDVLALDFIEVKRRLLQRFRQFVHVNIFDHRSRFRGGLTIP